MKKILLSLAVIVFVGAIAVGATGAFFSDTETSTGNTFTAGAIDLKIDNHAWYNGNECALGDHDNDNTTDDTYAWVGNAAYPVPGDPCTGTWELDDLTGHLFFDFDDLKPGDWEEDTISIHVNNNDAWVCSTLTLTSNDENDVTEPEEDENDNPADPSIWDGELANALNFIFWADDGDNVLEVEEQVVLEGTPADLIDGQTNSQTFPIADSNYSIFGSGPIPGGNGDEPVVYIGKAFCFGDFDPEHLPVNGQIDSDPNTWSSPAVNPGFGCLGANETNITQTDSVIADISFSAVQSRNNESFSCIED